MRPLVGQDAFHPGVFDSELLVKQGNPLTKAVVFGLDPQAGIELIFHLAVSDGEATLAIETAWPTAERT